MIHIDLHSHILPGIDDGAEDTGISLGLLQMEADQGVEEIVFTPHFDPKKDSPQDFLSRREDAYKQLQAAVQSSMPDNRFIFHTGAEIRFSPSLTRMENLDSFCISGTKALLIEFSFTHQPEFIKEVFYRLQLEGYLILMAHVERYSWMRSDPDLLYDLVCNGAFAQVNADEMLQNRNVRSFIFKMLKNGLIHAIGSDTHNLTGRTPRIKEASELIEHELGGDYVDDLNRFAQELTGGYIPDARIPVKPRKQIWDFLKR